MITYNKLKHLFLVFVAAAVILPSCTKDETAAPTTDSSVTKTEHTVEFTNNLVSQLVEDQDFRAYGLTLGSIYRAQAETIEAHYNGDAKAYQEAMQPVMVQPEEATEGNVATFSDKIGVNPAQFYTLIEQQQVVFEKYPQLHELTQEELSSVFASSFSTIAEKLRSSSRSASAMNGDCEDACTFDYLACISAATGVSFAALAGCLALSACPPCVAACVGLVVIADAFAIGGCYFKLRACNKRC